MRVTVTIDAALEIFQQVGIVRPVAMAMLTIVNIAMLFCVTDNTRQSPMLEFG